MASEVTSGYSTTSEVDSLQRRAPIGVAWSSPPAGRRWPGMRQPLPGDSCVWRGGGGGGGEDGSSALSRLCPEGTHSPGRSSRGAA